MSDNKVDFYEATYMPLTKGTRFPASPAIGPSAQRILDARLLLLWSSFLQGASYESTNSLVLSAWQECYGPPPPGRHYQVIVSRLSGISVVTLEDGVTIGDGMSP